MFTTSEKTVKSSSAIQRQRGTPFFARKHDTAFFGGGEKSFFGSSFIQPRLSVSQPDDPQEKEADQMANRVMTMPETTATPSSSEKKEELQKADEEEIQTQEEDKKEEVQRQEDKEEVHAKSFDFDTSGNKTNHLFRQKAEEKKDEHINPKENSVSHSYIIQRSGRSPPSTAKNSFEQSLSASKGSGSPLPGETRSFMESRFNADFTGIRVHTGESSVQMNKDIHAHAFTFGNDIFFNSGKYSPGTSEGQYLIAHELTHTIQQGASNHVSGPTDTSVGSNSVSAKLITRKKAIHRSTSNMTAAVAIAKGEAGKVIANKEGPDGFRVGWPQLVDYFKTTLGPEKIISEGQAGDSTTVSESQIRKKQTAKGVDVVTPDNKVEKGKRDAMPSWCGIFVFWALNKSGLPMKKWTLGKMTIPPEAAFSPGTTPPPGAIAYRKERSHYGMVERSDGISVTTVNGNTAGDDHLGGEVQVQTHPLNNWLAFIDPMKLIEGAVRNPEIGVEEKPRSLSDLRKELFGIQRKEPTGGDQVETQPNAEKISPAPANTVKPVTESERKEELIRKEEKQEEPEKTLQPKSFVHDEGAFPANKVQRRSEPKIQRGIFSAIGGAISSAVEWVGDKLEEGKKWLLGKIRNLIMKVPGYKALRVVLGEDPVTGEHVERNGKNFIDAALDIMPLGDLLQQKMKELGILEKAEQFVDKTIGRIKNLVNGIFDTFSNFWSSISLSDLKDIPGVFRRLENVFTSFFNHIKDFAVGVAGDFLEFIKKALLIPLGTYIKTKTRYWDLLCLIMGKDPLTDEARPVNGTNILNAFLNLSEWGAEQRKKMQETGTFSKVAAWIDKGIAIFSKSYDELKAAFTGLWNYVNIQSLMHPVETFGKIFDSFWRPIARVGSYIIETGIMILKIVKDVLFKWISNEAGNKKGYFLITVLINKDPFTGETVPRTTENIIKGFMMLTDGGEEQFNKMKESGAMDRATQKIDAAVKTLGFTLNYVKGLFINLWESLGWKDFLVPVLAFAKIIGTFKDPVLRLIRFVITVMTALFEVILRMMGFPVDMVFKLIDNVKKAWNSIKANPSGFFMNVLKAIKQGFVQFFDNFLTHLVNGLTDWFFDQLKDVGVTRPPDFSLRSIIALVLQVLGISMEKIWKKLGDKIGHDKVARIRGFLDKIEGIWKFIKDVQERGISAIWDYIKEQLSNLWTLVLEAATRWIMDKIITQITAKLLSMLDPTGIMAVVNSCIAIYKAIESFIRYFTQMLEIVNSFVEGIIEIAEGNIKKAADFLERSMARAIPIVIGFLANQVGLGKIGRKIVEIIEKVQETVDKALDWLIDKAVSLGTSFMNTLKQGVAAVSDWWKARKAVKTSDGMQHSIYFEGSGNTAKIMIATTPMTIRDYVAQVKNSNKLKDADIQKPLETVGKIETKEKENPIKEDEKTKKTNEMSELMAQLATDLATLPLGIEGQNSGAIYGGAYMGYFGTTATVAFQKAPFTRGSDPTVTSPVLSDMNIRKQGGNPYYIKGHLLNDNLGGPGNTWSNLTPISNQANNDHKNHFENPVKEAVNGTSARLSSIPPKPLGYMKGFSVIATYGRSEPSALTHLKDDSTDDLPPGADPGWDAEELTKILEAEKHSPTRLVCRATIQKQGETAEKVVSYTVMNEIHYGNLSQYQLGIVPKRYVELKEFINPSASTPKQMADSFSEIRGIGEARAVKIYNSFKNKGRITNGKTDIGIGLLALNKMNKGLSIKSGVYSGPWPAVALN